MRFGRSGAGFGTVSARGKPTNILTNSANALTDSQGHILADRFGNSLAGLVVSGFLPSNVLTDSKSRTLTDRLGNYLMGAVSGSLPANALTDSQGRVLTNSLGNSLTR